MLGLSSPGGGGGGGGGSLPADHVVLMSWLVGVE